MARSTPDFDGTPDIVFENETTSKFSLGLKETSGSSLGLKVVFNPPLRWNMQQQGGNLQG